MSSDSHLFSGNKESDSHLPLYEVKLFHQYDHRWATYMDSQNTRHLTTAEKQNPHTTITPRYWVSRTEVENRLANKWNKQWLIAFRNVTNATNERTAIFSIIPRVGVSDTAPILFVDQPLCAIIYLITNFSSLVFDYITRQKLGGTHLTFFILRQLPVIPPTAYSSDDLAFIVPRVLELVYTAYDLKPFADDVWRDLEIESRELIIKQWETQPNQLTTPDFPLPPFIWNPDRRAILRAELDAYYARLYGLTRDELRYILDPADIYGADFPSETFRVLKEKEIKQYGEYRTQKLVLEAWDRMQEANLRK